MPIQVVRSLMRTSGRFSEPSCTNHRLSDPSLGQGLRFFWCEADRWHAKVDRCERDFRCSCRGGKSTRLVKPRPAVKMLESICGGCSGLANIPLEKESLSRSRKAKRTPTLFKNLTGCVEIKFLKRNGKNA